jgi:NAD(P)-dependent dehydrogenase (short-subunit alcohol dehydrogenase family)
VLVLPCDIGDPSAVTLMAQRVLQEFGEVEVLVNAAGTNAPNRALEVLSLQDYRAMMDANLHGAYYCVQAFLPGMRARGSGTIVNVVSDAGKQASPKAGPAYVMSKFGMAGLTQSINAEERGRGVRACAIFPGDIDTPLLDKRPVVPDAEARARMMKPEEIAECVVHCINLPSRRGGGDAGAPALTGREAFSFRASSAGKPVVRSGLILPLSHLHSCT